jgi:hypothetical protein
METFKQSLNLMICINCNVGLIYPHDEEKYKNQYEKCEFCGFTREKKKKDDLHKVQERKTN